MVKSPLISDPGDRKGKDRETGWKWCKEKHVPCLPFQEGIQEQNAHCPLKVSHSLPSQWLHLVLSPSGWKKKGQDKKKIKQSALLCRLLCPDHKPFYLVCSINSTTWSFNLHFPIHLNRVFLIRMRNRIKWAATLIPTRTTKDHPNILQSCHMTQTWRFVMGVHPFRGPRAR